MSIQIYWIYLFLSVCFIIWQLHRKNDLDMLPSWGWFLMISVPFAVQMHTFAPDALDMQIFGIAFVGTCLMAGDGITIHPRYSSQPELVAFPKQQTVLDNHRLFIGIFIALAVLHLSLLENIPLWEKYVHQIKDESILQSMRENSSKLLNIPRILKYVFNWIVNIIAPIAVYLLINKKRYVSAAAFFIIALLYANMSLAKFPTIIMIMAIIISVLWNVSFKTRTRIYLLGMVLMIPVALHAISFFINNPESVFRYTPVKERVAAMRLSDDDPRSKLTYGDNNRLKPRGNKLRASFAEGRYDYLVYRTFLGPTDVASRWYQFFPKYSGEHIGFEGILPGTRGNGFIPPAQKVGNWAYTSRFPEWYFVTAHAYASADADAYARFGITGIIFAGLFIFILRIGLKFIVVPVPISQALYAGGIVMLALLLPIASLQALLVANGLLVIFILMLITRIAYGFPFPDIRIFGKPKSRS